MKANGTAPPQPVAEEKALVQAAQAGAAEAFARLYDLYVERIFRYVYFRVSDDQLAEDITSEVFLKAWENLDHYRWHDKPFIAWLYSIAHHAVIDQYRAARPSIALDEAAAQYISIENGMEESLDQHLRSETVRKSLQRLTGDQQEVLTLRFIAGLSTEEIARQMGKRQGAVRALQMRALKALAEDLGILELNYEEL
jgi:RNA polymerase sigma-70 factor, ECF subfamily